MTNRLPAFSGYGIELEYMIVEHDSLSTLPIADRLLQELHNGGAGPSDFIGWSNELVLHVIEIKNTYPTPALEILPDEFGREIRRVVHLLTNYGARLMPTGMHPWMNPLTATRVWPHDDDDIYGTYDRIFDCRRHGWSNLQSMHINLPFADDAEFARLHAAIRVLLPLIPALAASSPIADGELTGFMDYRLEAYKSHTSVIPSITGQLIPEVVTTRAEYEAKILAPMFRDIASHDPEGVLRHEWLNCRGAIARFDRHAIEIRLADVQECAQADIAIAAATSAVVREMYAQRWSDVEGQNRFPTGALVEILFACMREGEEAIIDDRRYLQLLGFAGHACRAGDLWRHLLEKTAPDQYRRSPWSKALRVMLEQGTLARRILDAVGSDTSRPHLYRTYERLCECLEQGKMFG